MGIFLLAFLGCSVPTVKIDDSSAPDDTGAPDSPGGDDSATGDDSVPPDDSATGDDSAPPAVAATGLAVSEHPEISTVLIASWQQKVAAESSWLSWELDGTTWTSPERARDPGDASEVLLGLPADTAVTVTLHERVDGVESTFSADGSTGALPRDLVIPTLSSADESRMRPEPYLLTSVNVGRDNFFGPCYTVILDRQGRVVWYRDVADSRLTLFPRVSRAGGYITWDATTYYSGGSPGVIRATLDLGQEEETLVEDMGLTYDELPDGTLLFDATTDGYHYYLTKQDGDGTQTQIWDCYDWMKAYNRDYWACAPNTVLWNPDDDSVLWSMFQTSTVVLLDLDSGEMLWHMGRITGGLTFDPDDISLSLQHYPNWTPDGTLLVSTHVPGAPRTQTLREFSIDADSSTATQVWSYTNAEGYYAEYAGEGIRLSNGDTLEDFGTDGVLQEVTSDGEVVWELDWSNHLVGHSTPITDLYALNVGW